MHLTTEGWIALLVTAAVFIILQVRRGAPVDLLFLGATVSVTLCGVITPAEALDGFANPAVITIGSLLVVAASLQSTGVLDWVGRKLLGRVRSEDAAFRRLTIVLVGTSAFLLNTALVAMMVPVVVEWCRRRGISPSRLLIPVSYLAILGGVCTLLGTSTTLIVNGMLKSYHENPTVLEVDGMTTSASFLDGIRPMDLFEIGRVGLPCALIGTVVLTLIARRFLPNRMKTIERLAESRREYLVEKLVQPGCPLIGQSIEAAGLRELPGLFVVEIDRDKEIITPVNPNDVIREGDCLVFAGVVSTIVDLEKISGLVPTSHVTFGEKAGGELRRNMTEAVLSRSSPLIGTTIKAANFRRRYNAAVVAVHRSGERLTSKIGQIQLEPGDTLLLQTRNDFVAQHRNNPDFYLVSRVEGYAPRRHDRALLAGILGIVLILWLAISNVDLVKTHIPICGAPEFPAIASMSIAALLVVTRCVSINDARRSLNLQVLLTIVGALGLGQALESSGAAHEVAVLLVSATNSNPYLLLIVTYALAMLFTEMITNNAVATILLPIAIGVAQQANINPRPLVMAIALAASLSFLTPIGYQTNLMVMGPGGYYPRDYLRVGLPVAIAVAVTAIVLIPMVWPF